MINYTKNSVQILLPEMFTRRFDFDFHLTRKYAYKGLPQRPQNLICGAKTPPHLAQTFSARTGCRFDI
jgi:hypothetical protein